MAWIVRVDHHSRSPIFKFVLGADDPRPFPPHAGREFEQGYRYAGTPVSGLLARKDNDKKLCDAFHIIGHICISAKVKGIIDSLEPGLHQFFPIALEQKDGTPYQDDYFILNVCSIVDAYMNLASASWSFLNQGEPPFRPYISYSEGTVSAPEIARYHLWVGGFTGYRRLHISDELETRLRKAKIRYLWTTRLEETDAVWRPDEQMPQAMRWLEADRANITEMIETRPDWVRRHRPQWLS